MASSFTARAPGRANVLISPCEIAPIFDPKGPIETHPAFRSYNAIWDTGATNTVINQRVVDECGLKPVGMTLSRDANETRNCEVYLVNLKLLNGILFPVHRVTKQNLAGADALIGMDIIGVGDFAVTSEMGKTVFSFRVPSEECIDFCAAKKGIPTVGSIHPHRNDPCPCGSGKKYKNCHGSPTGPPQPSPEPPNVPPISN